MKSLTLLKSTFYLLLGLGTATQSQAADYYTYRDPDGKLVISNKQPPSGSKIIKQQNLTDTAENPDQQSKEHDDRQPNEDTKASPTSSKNK